MLILIYGCYHFAARRIAYRNDYCLRCDCVHLAELIQTFDAAHVCYIPLLPLGRWRRWHCTDCGHNPHKPVAASQARKAFVAAAFALLTIFGFLMPITRAEDAAFTWGFRVLMFLFFLVALAWCRTKPPTNLKEQLVKVPPLPQDSCIFCRGPLDARGVCRQCKLARLDVNNPRPQPL